MDRPNIIVLLADQHRWDCTGYAGNADLRTPNLDALAGHGVSFTQAVCPYALCVPSRVTLMTGQYVSTHGVAGNRDGLPATATTLPGLLHAAGYDTACVGKMHFNPTYANYAFNVMRLSEQDGDGRNEDDYHKWLEKQGEIDQIDVWDQVNRDSAPPEYWDSFGAMRSNLPEALHSTRWVGDQAVRFLQRAREPFFLWAGFIKPHHPFDPPEPWDRLYDPRELSLPEGCRFPPPEEDTRREAFFDLRDMTEDRFRRVLAYYYANISHMDEQIGRILATLTSRGFTNNVVVYCADHGDYMGQHGLILKGGARPYDALLRVPLLIAGVGGQRRGYTDPALAQLTDVTPTLLEAAAVAVPDTVEGSSLVPQLRRSDVPLRDVAFVEGGGGLKVARTQRYKLIETSDADLRALYDLDNDPHEYDNRYGHAEMSRVQAELEAQLTSFVNRPRPA